MAVDPPGALVPIGEVARRTRLTHKALRIYDRGGLLRPVVIDANGYRRYGVDQVRAGRIIGLLRGAGLGLTAIGLVLAELDTVGDRAAKQLERVLADLEREHANRKLLIRHVQSTLRQGDDPMFPIRTRHVPALRVMSVQRRLRAPETDDFVREAKAAFAQHLGSAAATGPFTLIFHGTVDGESDGPLEAVLGCPDHVRPTDLIGIRTEPAHDEAYTAITKAQWAYPAILAAYDAVACSPEAVARPGGRLSCREVYTAEPDAIGEDEVVCDVAFPLGERR